MLYHLKLLSSCYLRNADRLTDRLSFNPTARDAIASKNQCKYLNVDDTCSEAYCLFCDVLK